MRTLTRRSPRSARDRDRRLLIADRHFDIDTESIGEREEKNGVAKSDEKMERDDAPLAIARFIPAFLFITRRHV